MKHAYKLVLLVGYLVLPGVVLAWGNAFRSRRRTLLRAAAATALAWLWLVGSTLTVTSADIWLADSDAEIEAIAAGDGAKLGAVLAFGWLPSLVLVLLSWLAIHLWRAAVRARSGRAA